METKGKPENQKANLEIVLESISEDLRANADSANGFLTSIEKLNSKIDILVESKKASDKTCESVLKEIRQGNILLSNSIEGMLFSVKKLEQVADNFEKNRLEEKPLRETKVIHKHHISKAIWVAASLFILLALESAGWLNTINNQDQYRENDTKYRFMRLDTTAKYLQEYLDSLDARYKSNPELRKMVIDLEDQYRKNMERLEKAEQLKQEAKDLEKKVHTK